MDWGIDCIAGPFGVPRVPGGLASRLTCFSVLSSLETNDFGEDVFFVSSLMSWFVWVEIFGGSKVGGPDGNAGGSGDGNIRGEASGVLSDAVDKIDAGVDGPETASLGGNGFEGKGGVSVFADVPLVATRLSCGFLTKSP